MNLYDFLIAPFADYAFMQRALVGSIVLSISACPVGVFLMLRRMSLSGDAMAHAILPGAAIGYLIAGLSLPAMTIGGVIAGTLIGIAIGSSRLVYDAMYPLLVGFNSIPKVAVVPILVIWFGSGTVPAVITSLVICIFPVVVNVATGLATTEPELEDVLRALGPDGYLINVARGSVVDEAALIRALDEGLVAGMTIVGIDFRDGILFVPEVLLAANAMKAGMATAKFCFLATSVSVMPSETAPPE